MNQIKSTFLFKIAKLFVIKKAPFLTAFFLRLVIYERKSNGKDSLFFTKKSDKITILASNSEKYRGDLDALSSCNKFRVLHIKQKWQRVVQYKFYIDKFSGSSSVIRAKQGSDIYRMHKKLSSYLESVLFVLRKMIDIDCIIVPNYRYLDDYEWVIALKKFNIPSIMLYRECLVDSKLIYYFVTERHRHTKMYVDHIIVHNEKCKQSFIDAEYCNTRQISVAGVLRMDVLMSKINKHMHSKNTQNKRKKFTFFYFPYNSVAFGGNINEALGGGKDYVAWNNRKSFFLDIHSCIALLAKENKDIDFIIKPKKTMMRGKSWLFYEEFMKNNKVGELNNYIVDSEINVHDLIIESDVVCAFHSTVALEAAYAGKRVIMPLYYNFKNTKYYDIFIWKKHIDLFDVVIDNKTLIKTFQDAFKFPKVEEHVTVKRKRVFDIFFGVDERPSLDKYSQIIEKVVMNGNTDS